MPYSRRDLFIRMFTKTVQEAPELLPGSVKDILGIESKPKIATPEQAAFELAKRPRKKIQPFLQSPELSQSDTTIHTASGENIKRPSSQLNPESN